MLGLAEGGCYVIHTLCSVLSNYKFEMKLKNIEVIKLTQVVETPVEAEGVLIGFPEVLSISREALQYFLTMI